MYIVKVIGHYFLKVVEGSVCDEEVVCSILDAAWRSLKEARRIMAFWDVLEAFVQAAFIPCLLALPPTSPVIHDLTNVRQGFHAPTTLGLEVGGGGMVPLSGCP